MEHIAADREFIERIVDEHSDLIIRIAMHHVHSMGDAEDIAQTVFLRFLRNPVPLQSKEHEKAWIIRVTVNLCKDYCKSSWYRKRADLLEESLPVPEADDSPDVLGAVRALSPNYKNVIYLHYYEGYKVSEIAQSLNVREGTVMSWLSRARGELKNIMKGEFEDA